MRYVAVSPSHAVRCRILDPVDQIVVNNEVAFLCRTFDTWHFEIANFDKRYVAQFFDRHGALIRSQLLHLYV